MFNTDKLVCDALTFMKKESGHIGIPNAHFFADHSINFLSSGGAV